FFRRRLRILPVI
ncbi:ribonucleoside-diphosphate reductase, alpha subunit, partial [Chlamydia psittaci 84-8471/1]